jgi:hypothetical protein
VASTSDLPPDAGAEPDAISEPARGLEMVETYATPSVVPGNSVAGPAASVAPYTANCANGSCGVRSAPVYRQPVYQPRRRLFGRFR